jgi:hypothetical protein
MPALLLHKVVSAEHVLGSEIEEPPVDGRSDDFDEIERERIAALDVRVQ